jgi:thioredoxin-like negative regulator of GroEL
MVAKQAEGYVFSLNKVAVYFSASWCEPCKTFFPQFKRWAQQIDGLEVVKVDVEKDVFLGQAFNVRAVPAIVFLRQGKSLGMKLGATHNESDLVEFMQNAYA